MAMTSTDYLETEFWIKGIKLAAKIWGPEDGKPMIAVHGWLDNAASFDRLAPRLTGYRVCALDLAGHGRSDHRPAGVLYNFVDYFADVIGVANSLEWETFSLMGHSMGAGISLFVAGSFPERIDKLILLDGVGPPLLDDQDVPKTMRASIKKILRSDPDRMPRYEDEEAAIQTRYQMGDLSLEAVRTLCARGLRRYKGGVTWSTDPRIKIRNAMRLSAGQIQAFIERIDAPTLVVMARQGFPWGDDLIAERLKHFQNLRHHSIDGGHHVHLEIDGADAIADLITRW